MASVARPLDLPIDANSEVPFYIPATGPATRPRRTLKYGDTFIVLDSHGDIGASAGGTDGLSSMPTRAISLASNSCSMDCSPFCWVQTFATTMRG